MELIELLKEWVRLAPDECRLVECKMDVANEIVEFSEFWVRERPDEETCIFIPHSETHASKAFDCVQGVVQRAIVQRQLRVDVTRYGCDNWTARVFDLEAQVYTEKCDKEPAIALLTAYLAYLKQETA